MWRRVRQGTTGASEICARAAMPPFCSKTQSELVKLSRGHALMHGHLGIPELECYFDDPLGGRHLHQPHRGALQGPCRERLISTFGFGMFRLGSRRGPRHLLPLLGPRMWSVQVLWRTQSSMCSGSMRAVPAASELPAANSFRHVSVRFLPCGRVSAFYAGC